MRERVFGKTQEHEFPISYILDATSFFLFGASETKHAYRTLL